MRNVSESDSLSAGRADSDKSNRRNAFPPGVFGRWDRSSYWLSRFLILRWLGFVYFFAFLAAANQIVPLVGRDGLLPAKDFLERVAAHFGSSAAGFSQLPSLFWFDVSDSFLRTAAWFGVALSIIVFLGYANAILMTVLW